MRGETMPFSSSPAQLDMNPIFRIAAALVGNDEFNRESLRAVRLH